MPNIEYSEESVLDVLRTLNELVVSLDRIGTATADLAPERRGAIIDAFIQDHGIFKKAARARAILSEPFPTALGPDDMEFLEREMQSVTYWTMKNEDGA